MAGVAALLVVVALVVAGLRGSASAVSGEVYQAPAPGEHVPPGTTLRSPYEPPSSGQHYPTPANWGVYQRALAPGDWVHNLEHCGIVVLYDPARATPQLRQQVAALYDQVPDDPRFGEHKLVVTPYPGLDHLLRAQAWGWTLPLDRFDASTIIAFYREHVERGPEQVP